MDYNSDDWWVSLQAAMANNSVELVSIHSHASDRVIIPSTYSEGDRVRCGDLPVMGFARKCIINEDVVDVKNIIGITIYKEKREFIDLLLIQEVTPYPISFEVHKSMGNMFHNRLSQEEVVERLMQTGLYNAELVKLGEKGWKGGDMKKIMPFAFTPKILRENNRDRLSWYDDMDDEDYRNDY